MEIDYSLYPKHNWKTSYHDDNSFFELNCIDCPYGLRVRVKNSEYISEYIAVLMYRDMINYSITYEDMIFLRKELLSCEEVMIKMLLE